MLLPFTRKLARVLFKGLPSMCSLLGKIKSFSATLTAVIVPAFTFTSAGIHSPFSFRFLFALLMRPPLRHGS
jgi:hypothetical protein